MNWLSLLSIALSNSHVRSFLLGLSGVVGTYLTQYLSGQDFGPTLTPLVAAGLPVLVNALQKWLTRQPAPAPDAVDLSKLNLLGPLTPEQETKLAQQGYQPDYVPPETPRLMRDEIPFSLLWLVPLLWLCCQAAQASPPKAIINGPTTGVRGEILVLDASQSEGAPTHFNWRITPEIRGRKQLDVKDDGRRVQVASFGGIYLVTLLVSNADGNDILQWQVDIPGDAPCPSPEPQPVTPTPTPPAPTPGRFGIGARVRAAVLGVSSPTRAAEVAKLRSSLSTLKTQAGAGQVTPQQFLDAIVAELKGLPDSWQLVKTLTSLGIRFLVNGGQLKTVEDWIDLAGEILDALNGL